MSLMRESFLLPETTFPHTFTPFPLMPANMAPPALASLPNN